MYSYEQRLRAVELYIQLGKRVGATIRQLGYPSTAWTLQQLREVVQFDQARQYLIHDRDSIFARALDELRHD